MTQPTQPKKCSECWWHSDHDHKLNRKAHPPVQGCTCPHCHGTGVDLEATAQQLESQGLPNVAKLARAEFKDTKSSEKQLTDAVKQYLAAGGDPDFVIMSRNNIPDPAPSEKPIKGVVVDAGGGMVDVLVDRDTESYPPKGARVRLIIESDPAQGELSAEEQFWALTEVSQLSPTTKQALKRMVSRQVEAELQAIQSSLSDTTHWGLSADSWLAISLMLQARINALKGDPK